MTDTYVVIVFSDISFSEGSRREKHLKTIWITRIPTLQRHVLSIFNAHVQRVDIKLLESKILSLILQHFYSLKIEIHETVPNLTGNEGFEHEMQRK